MISPNRSTALEKPDFRQEQHSPSYLIKLQRGAGGVSVFCFLYSGGFRREFSSYATLAPVIGRDHSFYGIIASGTDGVSKPHRSVEAMASAYVDAIRTVQPTGPYFILGECFSAPVAIETANQLLAAGESMALLGLLDARKIPDRISPYVGHAISAVVRHYLTYLTDSPWWNNLKTDVLTHLGRLRRLNGVKRIGYLCDKTATAFALAISVLLRRTKPQSKDPAVERNPADRNPVEAAKARHLSRSWNAYSLTVRRYRTPPYAGKLVVIANEQWCSADPTLGWAAAGGIKVHKIPGDHSSYLNDHLRMVADILRNHIENGRKGAPAEPN